MISSSQPAGAGTAKQSTLSESVVGSRQLPEQEKGGETCNTSGQLASPLTAEFALNRAGCASEHAKRRDNGMIDLEKSCIYYGLCSSAWAS